MDKPVAVVVGVGPGLGSALARRFAEAGMAVAIARRNPEHLAELAEEIGAKPYDCDATDGNEVEELFTAVEDEARARGLTVLGSTTQDRFLINNGILDCFEPTTTERWNDPREVRRRLQAMQLIHPQGMGRRFTVIVLSKNCDRGPTLAGLRDPFPSSRSPRRSPLRPLRPQ